MKTRAPGRTAIQNLLDDAVLDRIDEIVAPGSDLGPVDERAAA
ncbi:hypothetical protein AB0I98_32030 [Streptomyces sp. NPDC050211]